MPTGAERGWVTTLVGELQKVLRRKLGAAGARVWMDHRLAANQNVTEELLDQIRTSRTLLLVMSPGYQKSEWCQRELANYVARASARGKTQSVFPIEIEPVNREAWHPALKSLTPIKFWHHEPERAEPKLAGYPVPKPDEDSLYWDKVNSLAHLSNCVWKPTLWPMPQRAKQQLFLPRPRMTWTFRARAWRPRCGNAETSWCCPLWTIRVQPSRIF